MTLKWAIRMTNCCHQLLISLGKMLKKNFPLDLCSHHGDIYFYRTVTTKFLILWDFPIYLRATCSGMPWSIINMRCSKWRYQWNVMFFFEILFCHLRETWLSYNFGSPLLFFFVNNRNKKMHMWRYILRF